MTAIPLTLGPLIAEGFAIKRSGVYWLCEDGHHCRPNEVVAYCNIGLERVARQRSGILPMADEQELQVAFAAPCSGYLRIDSGKSPGGYLNAYGLHTWKADDVLAHLDPDPDQLSLTTKAGQLGLLFLAGRRMTGLADVDLGLLAAVALGGAISPAH
jgi:hypothetical protein